MLYKEVKITVDELNDFISKNTLLQEYGEQYVEQVSMFLAEAFANGAEVFADKSDHCHYVTIVTKVPEMEIGSTIGIIMGLSINYKNVSSWTAWVNSDGEYKSGHSLLKDVSVENYKDILYRSISRADICDKCGKAVGFTNLKHVGFADAVCKDCYEEANKEAKRSSYGIPWNE